MELIAYLDDNREWQKKDIDGKNLTCINYAFADIRGGKVERTLKKIHLINELKLDNPELKTCISIGGWGADGFSEGVATAATRKILIDSIISYIERYQFDGVDLDWEYPGFDVAGIKADTQDSENFLLFLQELRADLTILGQMNQKSYRLTIAVGATPELLEATATKNGHEYAKYLDYINVMTYDMRGSFTHTTGHHTNLCTYDFADELSVVSAVEHLISVGIPKNKIVIGGAFYGRVWQEVQTKRNHGLLQVAKYAGTQAIDYNQLINLITAHPEYVFFDEVAQSPYYFDGTQFISYENIRSLKAKKEYVIREGLHGLMYWEHSLDLSGVLFEALRP